MLILKEFNEIYDRTIILENKLKDIINEIELIEYYKGYLDNCFLEELQNLYGEYNKVLVLLEELYIKEECLIDKIKSEEMELKDISKEDNLRKKERLSLKQNVVKRRNNRTQLRLGEVYKINYPYGQGAYKTLNQHGVYIYKKYDYSNVIKSTRKVAENKIRNTKEIPMKGSGFKKILHIKWMIL